MDNSDPDDFTRRSLEFIVFLDILLIFFQDFFHVLFLKLDLLPSSLYHCMVFFLFKDADLAELFLKELLGGIA